MPVLFRAEQVARPADLEVAERDLESRAELGVFADRGEPLDRDLRERLAGTEGEVGVGVAAAPPDASADLVQLREPHAVGVLNDQRVGVGKVDAGLDDGGADQHVDLAPDERLPDIFEFVLVHTPVGVGDARLGERPFDTS